MTHGSLFAGIGGVDLAFQRCGVDTVWAAEKDPKCNSVRRRHFPNEETLTDVAAISGPRFRVDVLTGGFPCQDLSVAGKRAGLAGTRSGLFWEFARIIEELSPRWVLIENVAGLLSSNRGRDFGTVLGTLGKLGYGFAYRLLDAQWWGVPQRRRRVFIVGCLGDWRRAAKVLFEPESLPWDTPPSREAGKKVAGSVAACLNSGGNNRGFRTEPGEHLVAGPLQTGSTPKGHGMAGVNDQAASSGHVVAFDCKQAGEGGEVSPTLRALSHDKSHANAGGQVAVAYQCHGTNVGPMGTLRSGNGNETGGVPFTISPNSNGYAWEGGDTYPTLQAMPQSDGLNTQYGIRQDMAVRRLTPQECEKLQGFPPGWTHFGERGEEIADGPRYRMLGNAIAVPVVEWIARRVLYEVELCKDSA